MNKIDDKMMTRGDAMRNLQEVAQMIAKALTDESRDEYCRASVWEKYGLRRIYIEMRMGPKGGHVERLGYIEFDEQGEIVEVHPQRPGHYTTLKNLCQSITA